MKKITHYGGITEYLYYDTYGRLSSINEIIDNTPHNTFYSYNSYNQLTSLTYPSGFTLQYNYNSKGYLSTIKNGTNSVTIFTANSKNGLNQYTSYTLGNGKTSTISRPIWGIPINYYTPGVQDLSLTWDYSNGNLTSRNDVLKNKYESFTYDNLERLLSSSGTGIATIANTYATNGNINSKTDVGSYTYSNSKINAVTQVSNSQNNISTVTQDISYNSFFQPETLSEGNYDLTYTYGANDQRIKSVLKQNGNTVNTRYYFGDYEKDITGNTTRNLHYVSAGGNLVAIVERINNTDTYHYTYTDHLGSILAITNNSGTVTAEQNFDAWGRKRNPNTWAYSNIPASPTWLYRGYTLHEHLPEFGLINMNGRMYDPLVARMLSPDNFIHSGAGLEGFNRYTYAFNNPLKYSDPDGENPILIGALIGAVIHTGTHLATHNFKFKDWNWGSFLGSIVAGGISGGVGQVLNTAKVGGFYAGALTGASAGFSESLVSGLINQDLSIEGVFASTFMGAGIGGLIGGVEAELKGNRFIDGKVKSTRERWLTAGGNVPPKDNPNYDVSENIKINEVSTTNKRIRAEHSNINIPTLFEGDLTVEVSNFARPPGEAFFIELDGQTIYQSVVRDKAMISISSKAKTISWGLRNIGQNISLQGLIGYADPYIRIYGNYREFGGFLFWR